MQDVTHIKKFLGIALADKALRELTGIEWRDVLTKDDGTIQKLSRKMAYMFEYPVDYKYAGLTLPGIPWEKSAVEIKSVLEDHLFAEFEGPSHKFKFNSVLLNLYEDGRDSIRWHSDKERQLGKNPVIACINLGATRKFSFMRKREPIEAWQCWNEIRSIPQEVRTKFVETTEFRIQLFFSRIADAMEICYRRATPYPLNAEHPTVAIHQSEMTRQLSCNTSRNLS